MDQPKTNAFRPLRSWAICAWAALVVLGSSSAYAAPSADDCFDKAGAYQGVNPHVLRAVAWRESKGDVTAINRNANGSIDVGQLQINSIHFPELASQGIPHRALADPCVNIFVAAWLLKQKMVRYGNTWRAIGAYHSESPRERDSYARSIQAILVSWGLLQPER
ncbi:soluble lytic murein transglycosylase-like protein [Paraburkholderia youngii]|uniref:Soluble lytic murein transglycosylase-like protein n=1 Tax=Paraburkholderia youngii TaxID=2782701 RepID=A0A7W8LDS3_9BURK|nr:lytic transglycosylase domain-containing protein [Paraburkholderia youngii]MBB5403841.1 soluble lytic murein transglycosylase-like protein [Paraburkholderia youngii]NUX55252.1 lytic transglycosylase domain-containing protein [Paraburkholderia youngii]